MRELNEQHLANAALVANSVARTLAALPGDPNEYLTPIVGACAGANLRIVNVKDDTKFVVALSADEMTCLRLTVEGAGEGLKEQMIGARCTMEEFAVLHAMMHGLATIQEQIGNPA